MRKVLYNGLQYKSWTWARLMRSCNHAWNARSDVSTSGTAAKSTERGLQMDVASAGILPGAMSSKAFKWGMMPPKTELSVEAKHSRMMYLTKYVCFVVQ